MWKKFFKARPFFKRERLFILPTVAGFLLFLFTLVLFLMSAIYGAFNIQLMGFLMLSLYGISMIWTHSELKGLEIARIEARSAPADLPLQLRLWLESSIDQTRQNLDLQITLQKLGTKKKMKLQIRIGEVRGENSIQRVLEIEPQLTRGKWTLTRLHLSSRAPFGLYRAWKTQACDETFWVYPKRKTWSPMRAGRASAEGLNWISGDETFSHLEQSPQLSKISRVAAKSNSDPTLLYLKEFEASEAQELLLDWSQLQGDFETKLSLCSDAVWNAGSRIQVETPQFKGRVQGENEKERALRAWAESEATT